MRTTEILNFFSVVLQRPQATSLWISVFLKA
jgi:hypothetical protein